MEDKEKKQTDNSVEEIDLDKLETVTGGYPVFRDFSTDDEKKKRRTT